MAKKEKPKKFSLANLNQVFTLIKDYFNAAFDKQSQRLTDIDNEVNEIRADVNAAQAKFLEYAPLDSPEFEGVPTAPTADTTASTTQLATTQFVQQEIDRRASTFKLSVADTEIVVDKIEAVTSVLQPGGNPMHRLRDADGNVIAPVTLTTHIVDPETKKSLKLLIEEAAHIVLVSEANWEQIESNPALYAAFCEKYDNWYQATYDDDKEIPQLGKSYVDEAGNLTLDGTIDDAGNLTLNGTITENGILTL